MKKIIALAVALVMVFALCACGTAAAPAAETAPAADTTAAEPATAAAEPIVVKLTTTNSGNNPEVKAIVEHCKNIYDRTNGMLDIQVYADGQMLVYAEGIEAVMSNSAVIYYTACNLFSDYVPEFTTVYLPYLYSSTDICVEFMNSPVWQEISDKADAAGLHVIANVFCNGYRNTFANKPVTTAADFEGLKLRIPDSSLYIDTFTALKANYVTMSSSEMYSAIQTGMLDGCEGVPATAANLCLWETLDTSYYSMTKHILDNAGYFVGYDFWMSIPEDLRAIAEEELYAAAIDGNAANAELTEQYMQTLKDNGVNIVEIEDYSSFKDAVADYVASQPMGQEVLDQIAEIEAKNA